MYKALHPRDNVDRLYVSRKEGKRRLTSNEDNVDVSIEDYVEKCCGRLVTATRNNTDTKINRTEIIRKQKWEEKQVYGCFKRLTIDISQEKTLTWLKKGNPNSLF